MELKVEGSLRCVSGALGHAHEDRRQLQREHDAEIERLTEEMTVNSPAECSLVQGRCPEGSTV